jgi:choline dehydrogenase-like flavoprotein
MAEEVSRREFVKQTVAGTVVVAGASGVLQTAAAAPVDPNKQIVAALGSVFIPSGPGDPGYKELEVYGITDYVMEELPGADGLAAFNTAAKQFFDGKAFLDLDEKQRGEYLGLIAEGSKITDEGQRKSLQTFYRGARSRILSTYYKNYPEFEVKRNAAGDPILKPGDTHQVMWEYEKPNTKKIATGWNVAGYKGRLGWEEEEELREKAKKTWDHWYDGYLIKLNDSRPPAAAAIKTGDGHDYYDVIVLGGGTAGCIVAGRLAERGMNPKTGDRLKVAMIEGGDDWTIRDVGIRPGYGGPIRRSKITNIWDAIGPEGGNPGPAYRYPHWVRGGPAGYNFRLIGGCSNHYGGTCWIPGDEDFHFYREASGVDWDLGKFGDAIQEIRDMFHATALPAAWWSKSDHMWADAGRAMGFEMRSTEISLRNGLGIDQGEYLSRVDSKGTSLPWAYIGLNNGLKVIANAEVQKIVIEKVPGGRPVATGAVYTDKAGTMHEVRAARVIVACSANWAPLLLYKSGYGPRELLGDKVLVENKNVGQHLTGDCDLRSTAFLAEPITPTGRTGEMVGGGPWTAMTPRPWGELTVHIRKDGGGVGDPSGAALGGYAPGFGWEHKEYMRNMLGPRHQTGWATHFGAVPWSWRVLPPDGDIERVEMDTPRFEAKIKEAAEVIRAWSEKLAIKPVKTDFRIFSRPSTAIPPQHPSGTARAGASREESVCTSDFDCHDIDHLLFTSSSTIPRTFFWSLGPTAVNAAYSWRRMLANHFSTGSSTKGFA